MNNLGIRLSEAAHNINDIEDAWSSVLAGVGSDVERGWLLALRSRQADNSGDATALILEALTILNVDSDNRHLGDARRALRESAMRVGVTTTETPLWLTRVVPDEHIESLNGWLGHHDWPHQSAWLREHLFNESRADLLGSLRVMVSLYPTGTDLAEFCQVVERFVDNPSELDAYLDRGDRNAEVEAHVVRWLQTDSWTASRDMLAEISALRSDEARACLSRLAKQRDAAVVARQHLSILTLTARPDLQDADIFEWASDPNAALQRALQATDAGDLDLLRELVTLSPQLIGTLPHGLLVLAILHASDAIADDNQESALVGALAETYAQTSGVVRESARNRFHRGIKGHEAERAEFVRLVNEALT